MSRSVIFCCVFVVSLVVAQTAGACTCVPNPPPHDALDDAHWVFAGTVLSIEDADGPFNFPDLRVTLRVHRYFKSRLLEPVEVPRDEIEVRTAADTAACGFPFRKGQRYLIYVHEGADENGALRVSLCSRSARLEDAEADLLAFDAADLLLDDPGEGGGRCGGPSNVAAVQAMLFVLLAAALRRRRSPGSQTQHRREGHL